MPGKRENNDTTRYPVINKSLYEFLLSAGVPYQGWVRGVGFVLKEVKVVAYPINRSQTQFAHDFLTVQTVIAPEVAPEPIPDSISDPAQSEEAGEAGPGIPAVEPVSAFDKTLAGVGLAGTFIQQSQTFFYLNNEGEFITFKGSAPPNTRSVAKFGRNVGKAAFGISLTIDIIDVANNQISWNKFGWNIGLNSITYKNLYIGIPYALTEICYPGGFSQAINDRANLEAERRKSMGRMYLPLSAKSFFLNLIVMSIKEIYEYVYYKFYKSMAATTSWGIDWRASGFLLGFEIIFFFSFVFIYRMINPYNLSPISYELGFIPLGILYAIDHFTFHSKDQWKSIVEKYDAWPRKKNFRGTLIVWSVVILLLAYSFWVFYIYSETDWSQYQ